MQGYWEEGLLLAAREVCQDSLGFSPNDLVFGHRVRGPLAVLQDDWKLKQRFRHVRRQRVISGEQHSCPLEYKVICC